MFKRLQAIKPSPDISRDRLSREHQQNQKYMRMHQTGEGDHFSRLCRPSPAHFCMLLSQRVARPLPRSETGPAGATTATIRGSELRVGSEQLTSS